MMDWRNKLCFLLLLVGILPLVLLRPFSLSVFPPGLIAAWCVGQIGKQLSVRPDHFFFVDSCIATDMEHQIQLVTYIEKLLVSSQKATHIIYSFINIFSIFTHPYAPLAA